jgi:hypothetical protein
MGKMNAVYVLEKVISRLLNSFRKETNQCENLVRNKDVIQNINEVPNKTKNSWLYPTDQFGNMKTGVENESQNYEREMPSANSDLEITNP